MPRAFINIIRGINMDIRFKTRYRGRLKRGSMLLYAASALFLLASVIDFVDFASVWGAQGYFSGIFITAVGCVLVLAGAFGESAFLTAAAGTALTVGMIYTTQNSFLPLAGIAFTLSAAGMPFNKTIQSVSRYTKMPVLNLVSSAFSLLHILVALLSAGSNLTAFLAGAFASVGMLLLNLGCECTEAVPGEKKEKSRYRFRSLPGSSVMFVIGAVLAMVYGAYKIWNMIRLSANYGVQLDVSGIIMPVLIIAAGAFMLAGRKDRRFWTGSLALLTAMQLKTLLDYQELIKYSASQTPGLSLARNIEGIMFIALAFLLASSVGFGANKPLKLGRLCTVPLFNLISGAVLAVDMFMKAYYVYLIDLSRMPAGSVGAGYLISVIWGLLFDVLIMAGLILVNLSVSPEPVFFQGKGRYYGRGPGLIRGFYSDVGGSLQSLARICGGICLVCAFICLLVTIFGVIVWLLELLGFIPVGFMAFSPITAGLIGMVSCILAAVGTWPLYAFGQITSDIRAMRNRNHAENPSPADTADRKMSENINPDELPEL